MESVSEHPLAGAIMTAARERGLPAVTASGGRAEPGLGVRADVQGTALFVGRPDGLGLPAALAARARDLEDDGNTVVALSRGAEVLGLLAVADQLRPEATATIAALREFGIGQVVLLTGDNERTAAAVAAHAGVTSWQSGLLPEDKTAAVTRLRRYSDDPRQAEPARPQAGNSPAQTFRAARLRRRAPCTDLHL